jgi:hypothetical protein
LEQISKLEQISNLNISELNKFKKWKKIETKFLL